VHTISNGRRRGVSFAPVAALSTTLLLVAAAACAAPSDPDASAAAASDMSATQPPVRLAQNAPAKVSYSDAQANRGEDDYEDQCVDCHGEDLRGGQLGGAQLRGVAFEEKFGKGAPASALFMFMSTQMPPNAPGRLSPGTYADLMAYILKRNGYQAGAELPSDVDALDNLIVEK
jgi:cytochrome c